MSYLYLGWLLLKAAGWALWTVNAYTFAASVSAGMFSWIWNAFWACRGRAEKLIVW